MSDTVSAKHILVEQEYEAQDVLRKLQEGESFEDLAAKFSKCPSGKSGGDLGPFRAAHMVPSFSEAAFALGVGETSGPVQTQFGYHLIHRYE